VWFAILAIVCSEVPLRAGSAPIRAQNGAVCHSLPLADLLDRVIQQSARVQGISNDLHSEYVSPFTFLHALVLAFFPSIAVSVFLTFSIAVSLTLFSLFHHVFPYSVSSFLLCLLWIDVV